MDVRKEEAAKGDGDGEAKVANAPLQALLNERNFDFRSYGDTLSEGTLYCRTGRGTYVNVGDALDAHGRGLWRLWAYAFALHVSVLLYFACAMYADDKL